MTQLPILAKQMRAQLDTVQRGYIHRVLFGGLHLLLERRDDQWRLAIARINAVPSRTEAETVTKAFGLPEGIEWQWTVRKRRVNANVGRGRQPNLYYKAVECRWIERQ